MLSESSLPQKVAVKCETSLHAQALKLARQHRQVEGLLLETLDEIDRCCLYRTLGYSSLFSY